MAKLLQKLHRLPGYESSRIILQWKVTGPIGELGRATWQIISHSMGLVNRLDGPKPVHTFCRRITE